MAVGETVAVGGRTIVVAARGLISGAEVGVGVGVLVGIIIGVVTTRGILISAKTSGENFSKKPKTSKKIKNFLIIGLIIALQKFPVKRKS